LYPRLYPRFEFDTLYGLTKFDYFQTGNFFSA
jgi:hypothetical protein